MSVASDLRLWDLTDVEWRRLEEVIARFENAWRSGMETDIRLFVPAPDDPLRTVILAELIKVDQEYRWNKGSRKITEAYLEEWPELKQGEDLVAGLVMAECATRASRGDGPTWTTLQAEVDGRFPQLTSSVDVYHLARQSVNDLRPQPSLERLPLGPGPRSQTTLQDQSTEGRIRSRVR